MGTMNVSLPDSLKGFVEEQVVQRGYSTSSEYVRELIRADRARTRLRELLIEGGTSPQGVVADSSYFDELRERVAEQSA